MKSLLNHQIIRIFLPPFAGFLFYGGWAFIINSGHGIEKALIAAFTQGGYSFVITLVLAILIEWLFTRLSSVPWHHIWVFFIAVTILAVTSISLNIIVGTPEVLWTVLPGLLVSSVYTHLHLLTLRKLGE